MLLTALCHSVDGRKLLLRRCETFICGRNNMFSVAADTRNLLGECPIWCERTRRIYWTDIEGCELLALEEDTGVVMRWSLPERLGSFALTENSDVLLMGLASRFAFCDLNTGIFTPVVGSPGGPGTRSGRRIADWGLDDRRSAIGIGRSCEARRGEPLRTT